MIQSRVNILKKISSSGSIHRSGVTNNDPKISETDGLFDLLVVDAPAAAVVFLRDPDAINEWSGQCVIMCTAPATYSG